MQHRPDFVKALNQKLGSLYDLRDSTDSPEVRAKCAKDIEYLEEIKESVGDRSQTYSTADPDVKICVF